MRSNRELTRDGLSDRITQVAIEQQILDNHENPVTYSRDAVAKLENGERHPKTYTFRAIVAALGCNPEDLLVDFPGTKRRPEDPDLLTGAEIAAVLGDAADPIDILKGQLTTRAWNSVGRSGFLTIGEVSCALQSGELRDTPNLGHVQMNEIRSVLSAIAAERTEPDEDETDEDAGSVAV
jgi:transcriptional regulator with XRE-family HTH domain